MKFAIRDDDLNYFYDPEFVESNLKDIWDICPISMCVIPYVKGNWIKYTKILEDFGPNNVPEDIIKEIREDNKIYDIASNRELVGYIKEKIIENKIYLAIHGIHHKNDDVNLPRLKNNFSIRAEFFTNRDLTKDLEKAIKHMEQTFGQKITVFTPPQNIYSIKGFKAIANNRLNMCAYLPSLKNIKTISMIGVDNYFKIFKFRLKNKRKPFPYPIKTSKIMIIEHRSLQPGTNITDLYEDFEYVYSKKGNFVLSTHSYGFSFNMKGSNRTMGEVLKDFLDYVTRKSGIKFVSLDKVFEP
jgi:predicted deacetylase